MKRMCMSAAIVFAALSFCACTDGVCAMSAQWSREYVADSNMAAAAGAIQTDPNSGNILVVGDTWQASQARKGPGQSILWTISPAGSVLATQDFGPVPGMTRHLSDAVRGMRCNRDSELAIVIQTGSASLQTILIKEGKRAGQIAVDLGDGSRRPQGISVRKAEFFASGEIAAVGQAGDRAIAIRLDRNSREIWRRVYGSERPEPNSIETLIDVSVPSSEPNTFVAVGYSTVANHEPALTFGTASQVWVVKCSDSGKTMAEKRLIADGDGYQLPAICVLDSGDIVVAFARALPGSQRVEIVAHALSADLESVRWEKTMATLPAPKLKACLLKASSISGGFIVAHSVAVLETGIELIRCDLGGRVVDRISLPDSKRVLFDMAVNDEAAYILTNAMSAKQPQDRFRVAAVSLVAKPR